MRGDFGRRGFDVDGDRDAGERREIEVERIGNHRGAWEQCDRRFAVKCQRPIATGIDRAAARGSRKVGRHKT